MAIAVQCQVLREWGRFDEAIELLGRYGSRGKTLVIPALERRLLAVCALDMARIEAECGRADDAWHHIQEALAELGNDAKLGLKCRAASSWVLAARGLDSDSQRISDEAEANLAEFVQDPGTCRGVLYDLGMAACTRHDHAKGEAYWSHYLALSPDPVYRPTALYFRGECRWQMGDTTSARDDYRAAVAMEIDTHYSRLARRRLGQISLL
jgi:tetratricopeptide (TPR) repeat protein